MSTPSPSMHSSPASSPARRPGFTLPELLVAVTVTLLVALLFSATFILNQRVTRQTNHRAELLQNGRISLDRMTREIRQANAITTTLPADDSDPATLAHELMFEDGHEDSRIQYIRYYLDGTDLRRQIIVYEFAANPGTTVHWNATDAFGAPNQLTEEDEIIAEYVEDFSVFGNGLLHLQLSLQIADQHVELSTQISPRNA